MILNYKTGPEPVVSKKIDNADDDYLMVIIDKYGHKPNPKKQSVATHDKLHQNFKETKGIVDGVHELALQWNEEFYSNQLNYCKRFTPFDVYNLEIGSMWGFHIYPGEGLGKHEHWPATFAFAYYLDDADPLYFAELDYKTNPKAGELYLWRGHLHHESDNPTSDRYVISGSLNFVAKPGMTVAGGVATEHEINNNNDFFPRHFLNSKAIV